MRDVRIPADPADFQTEASRLPAQPREFRVRASGTSLVVEVLEDEAGRRRTGNTGYRIVFAPSSLLPTRSLSPAQIGAVADLGETVAFLPAMNDGGRQQQTVAGRSADRGWYLCVPVGQAGMTASPVGLMRSPWGI